MAAGRVLVIDDEPRILDIVRYFLEQGGYEVSAYTDPADGVEAARKNPFDVIVLDIVLKQVSGYDVAGRLKKLRVGGDTPILFMSSKVEMAELFLESYEGRAEFIQKPFRKERLLEQVASLRDGGGRQAQKTGAAAGRPKRKQD